MVEVTQSKATKKIIHIDMDCFYAAIEMRDNPELRNKPIAVGGRSQHRGVLCTCNYEARKYGCKSAMATAHAFKLCPDLILLPVNMSYYREISHAIRDIFHQYTDLIEPLSLDEAYLDVSDNPDCQGSATLIAKKIREQIFQEQQLTASAGIAPNKFLAKICSDWNKPNGQFTVAPHQVAEFVASLPVAKIFGVGKVTQKKMHAHGIKTCGDLQQHSQVDLIEHFGSFGVTLYKLARGIDEREVNPNRIRKSLSVEETYSQDIPNLELCLQELPKLLEKLLVRLQRVDKMPIKTLFVKLKFADFTTTTCEHISTKIDRRLLLSLCQEAYHRQDKPVRLIGVGVRFEEQHDEQQLSFTWE